MQNWMGILIRRERLKQNWSQEGLCRGICAVSYLSKIEQGKAEAGEDILRLLLERLGAAYETDGAFLRELGERVETLYSEFFSGRENSPRAQAALADLKAWESRCLASPYMLDGMLLLSLCEGRDYEALPDFEPAMTRRQYELYLLLMTARGEDRAEELLRLHPCGFFACRLGADSYARGRYFEAIERLLQAYRLASEEGSLELMCEAKLYLGNCYSDCGQKELMLKCYEQGRRMAETLGDERLAATVDYNIGSTFLSWGMAEAGYERLKGLNDPGALYCHKLALALEMLGRKEEALAALARGRAAGEDGEPEVSAMLDVVEYRLRHPDYLDREEYARLLEDTFQRLLREKPQGFARFHAPYMLEMYEHQRKYKEAYRLLKDFSPIWGGEGP